MTSNSLFVVIKSQRETIDFWSMKSKLSPLQNWEIRANASHAHGHRNNSNMNDSKFNRIHGNT